MPKSNGFCARIIVTCDNFIVLHLSLYRVIIVFKLYAYMFYNMKNGGIWKAERIGMVSSHDSKRKRGQHVTYSIHNKRRKILSLTQYNSPFYMTNATNRPHPLRSSTQIFGPGCLMCVFLSHSDFRIYFGCVVRTLICR